MTTEKKKEWLGSYSKIMREIDVLCEEHERISARMWKFKDIDENALQESVDRMQEIVTAIDKRVVTLVSKRKVLEDYILNNIPFQKKYIAMYQL